MPFRPRRFLHVGFNAPEAAHSLSDRMRSLRRGSEPLRNPQNCPGLLDGKSGLAIAEYEYNSRLCRNVRVRSLWMTSQAAAALCLLPLARYIETACRPLTPLSFMRYSLRRPCHVSAGRAYAHLSPVTRFRTRQTQYVRCRCLLLLSETCFRNRIGFPSSSSLHRPETHTCHV